MTEVFRKPFGFAKKPVEKELRITDKLVDDMHKCDTEKLLEIDDSIFSKIKETSTIGESQNYQFDDEKCNAILKPRKRKSNEFSTHLNKRIYHNTNELNNKLSKTLSTTTPMPSLNTTSSALPSTSSSKLQDNLTQNLFSQPLDTELIRQIDIDENQQENLFNLSQYFNTQIPTTLNNLQQSMIETCPNNNDKVQNNNEFTNLPNEKLNLTQMFMDDDDDFLNNYTNNNKSQSSQLFLDNIKLSNIKIVNEKIKFDNNLTTTKSNVTILENNENVSKYVQRQRTMQEENEINLNDEYLDSELSQAYKSSQYHNEVISVFDECEKSICNISSISNDNLKNDNDDDVYIDFIEPLNAIECNNNNNSNNSHMLNKRIDENEIIDLNDWTLNKDDDDSLLLLSSSPLRDVSNRQINNNVKKTQQPLITPTTIIRERLQLLSTNKLQNSTITNNKLFKSPPPPAPISSYTYSKMGPYFGLPLKVKKLIKDFKGINDLYDWQKECLQLPAIHQRHNLIYALPTSGGKTLVAEIIILREIICRRKNCIFLLPYVSIVQEKIWALSPFAVALDFLIEEYAAGKGPLPPRLRRKKHSVYIATIEKGLALLDSLIDTDRAHEIGLLVVDELHIIGELGRGATLETLLTKIKFINAGIQIIGMSATIGNLNEIAEFLNADTYTRDFRPIELKEYIKCGSDILEINSKANTLDDAFTYYRSINFDYTDEVTKMDPDHIAGLVSEIIPDESCLIFCPSKRNCENLAILLSQILSKKYLKHKKIEKDTLKKLIENDSGPLCPTLLKTIPMGIAYHHSGLTVDERRHLEDAFRANIICVICCTSTLAAGVNLPAKRVIVRSPYIGRDFITLSRYKQMIGRAGRAGMGNKIGESILICSSIRDNTKISNLLCSAMDEACSSIHLSDGKGLCQLILSAIGLNLANNQIEIRQLIDCTLLGIQSIRLNINKIEISDMIIKQLFKQKAITVKSTNNNNNNNNNKSIDLTNNSIEFISQLDDTIKSSTSNTVTTTKPKIILKPSTQFETSKLGKASFKSCIDLTKAKIIYKDLQQAQQSLVLNDYLHLLYLVTPYEPSDINLKPNMSIYHAQYLKLDAKHLHTARVIGITESCAMKMMSGKPFKGDLDRIVNRFFFTLMLYQLWMLKPIHEVAEIFHVSRGIVQNLIQSSASYASCLLKFCEELNEFWAFKELLAIITKRLSYCCTFELIPLMELPCVKLARAKQLYAAGYKNLQSIAKAKPNELVLAVEHLNNRVARQLISAAKILLLERVETLREEVQDCLDVLENKS